MTLWQHTCYWKVLKTRLIHPPRCYLMFQALSQVSITRSLCFFQNLVRPKETPKLQKAGQVSHRTGFLVISYWACSPQVKLRQEVVFEEGSDSERIWWRTQWFVARLTKTITVLAHSLKPLTPSLYSVLRVILLHGANASTLKSNLGNTRVNCVQIPVIGYEGRCEI